MLKFCRTKFVGYEKQDNGTILKIFGTLDDTIYSMQVELQVKLPELEIISIEGRMRRVTTPFCEEAQEFLQNAVGLKVEPGFQSKVKRLIGRPGCRHYGNLLNECLESIIPGLISIKYKESLFSNPKITFETVINELITEYPQIEQFCIGL
ncbi:MAG: DUF2889 domain-containing protein [Candidatus Lokiarchaeota archaeon]|nr:DUF2889 domain-containing protein [Candidatus Lokiarchaeota archaeon]